MIINQMLAVVAMALAGLAVGCAVADPAARLRRLRLARRESEDAHDGDPRGTGAVRPRPLRDLLAAVVRPRRGSPPTGQRAVLAGAVAVVLPLGLQAVAGVGPRAWFAAPVGAVGAYLVSGRLETPASYHRRRRLVDELPAALELLSAAIAAGLPLRSAVGELLVVLDGPLAEDLQQVLTGIDLGRDEATAWRALRDHPALGPISVDLARSLESGTMIAATLQRHAAIARRNRRGDREARARTVGVKSVPPLMLCFVPAFLLISIVPIAATGILQALQ